MTKYKVIAEKGLVMPYKIYACGSIIELKETTAKSLVLTGKIEEIQDEVIDDNEVEVIELKETTEEIEEEKPKTTKKGAK